MRERAKKQGLWPHSKKKALRWPDTLVWVRVNTLPAIQHRRDVPGNEGQVILAFRPAVISVHFAKPSYVLGIGLGGFESKIGAAAYRVLPRGDILGRYGSRRGHRHRGSWPARLWLTTMAP